MEKKMEEKIDFEVAAEELPMIKTDITNKIVNKKLSKQLNLEDVDKELISCLRNEKVIVRYIPKDSDNYKSPKHPFYGNMAENAVRIFTVPIMQSTGKFFNVLTDNEKNFLEKYMGLEYNALSIYLKNDNYWNNFSVRLTKSDNILDLRDPSDYIKYKVLIANKDFIAKSLQELNDSPKATYQFVLIMEEEESRVANNQMNATMQCYFELGKIQDDGDKLRVILEILNGKPLSENTKIDFLRASINKVLQSDPKRFLLTITDQFLNTKVLIKRCLENNLICKKGDFLYLSQDNSPLCESNEDPTLSIAAKFLNSPKRQNMKFTLEAKLKNI